MRVSTDQKRHILFNCRVGQCGTCATRVLAGEVEMEVEEGLGSGLRAKGYRLLCVGHARTGLRERGRLRSALIAIWGLKTRRSPNVSTTFCRIHMARMDVALN